MAGSMIVNRIEGCFYNVMGLPINTLRTVFSKSGIDLWDYIQNRFYFQLCFVLTPYMRLQGDIATISFYKNDRGYRRGLPYSFPYSFRKDRKRDRSLPQMRPRSRLSGLRATSRNGHPAFE